jgi:hypothetical protein
MSGKRTADIEFFKVTGEPSFIRRIFDYLPFWQGSTPKFRLIIEATNDIEHESNFLYSIEYGDGYRYSPQQLQIPPIKRGERRIYYLIRIPLIYTGDSFLTVTEILNLKANLLSGFQTVYSFHVTNRSWLFLTLLAGLLAGIFSTIGNLLIKLIN